ncbi:S1C family serine protease [Chloroflexota bacterium]
MKKIKIRNIALSLVLILSIVLGTGCNLLPDVDIKTSPPPTSPPTIENTTPVDSEWSTTPVESQAPILPGIADVVAKVKPSVVSINTELVTVDIFKRPRTQGGAGSGWIISDDGYIVTNNHVVERAESITVILDDGRAFEAEIVGADASTDLAIVKIDAKNLPAAAVGNSVNLRVGDWVVAIGNSLGQGIRATQGIVSRKDASLQVDTGQALYGLIETDAAINPGNSGGPLVNMAGEVVGITSAKLASVEVEAVGYAISTRIATPIIQQLINTGRAVHPWLGVSLYTVDEYVVERFDLVVDKGTLLVEVVADSPAGIAGLKPEDVIVGFAGEDIDTVDDLIQAIRSAQVGQKVEITYWRGESRNTTSATLIERPTLP